MDDDLVLDFNSKNLKFKEVYLKQYNIGIINDNINEFKRFTYELTVNEDFDKIFKTQVFQITFLDDTSNYAENLVMVYNAIADNALVNNRRYPTINERELICQLELRGFECFGTKLTLSKNKYKTVKKFRKKNNLLWN